MLHPRRREIIDEDKDAILYLLEEFKVQAPELPIEQVCQLIGGILNRTEKAVGFPAPVPVPPCPEFKRADEQMPSKVEAPKQATLEPQKAEPVLAHKTPTYDRDKLAWNRCPKCSSTKIGHVNKDSKPYWACFDCHIFLQADGKTKEMTK